MRLCCNSCFYSISKQVFHSGLGTPILIFPNSTHPHPSVPLRPSHLPPASHIGSWHPHEHSGYMRLLPQPPHVPFPLPLQPPCTHPFDCDWQGLCSIVPSCRLWWRHIHRAEALCSLYTAQKPQVCYQLHCPLMNNSVPLDQVRVTSLDTAGHGMMGWDRVCADRMNSG